MATSHSSSNATILSSFRYFEIYLAVSYLLEDQSIRSLLYQILQTIMQQTNTSAPLSPSQPKNVQQSNAQNAVLFEAINLSIHLAANTEDQQSDSLTSLAKKGHDPVPGELLRNVASLLGKFIT